MTARLDAAKRRTGCRPGGMACRIYYRRGLRLWARRHVAGRVAARRYRPLAGQAVMRHKQAISAALRGLSKRKYDERAKAASCPAFSRPAIYLGNYLGRLKILLP